MKRTVAEVVPMNNSAGFNRCLIHTNTYYDVTNVARITSIYPLP